MVMFKNLYFYEGKLKTSYQQFQIFPSFMFYILTFSKITENVHTSLMDGPCVHYKEHAMHQKKRSCCFQ